MRPNPAQKLSILTLPPRYHYNLLSIYSKQSQLNLPAKKDDGARKNDLSKSQNMFFRESSVDRLREISKFRDDMKREEKERKAKHENAYKDMGKEPKKDATQDEDADNKEDSFLRAYEKNIIEYTFQAA